MGLEQIVADAVVTAIEALGDIAKDVVYNVATAGEYDTVTGQALTTYEQSNPIKVVVSTVDKDKDKYNKGVAVDDSYPTVKNTTSDLKIMFASKTLITKQGVAIKPKSNDTVTYNSNQYEIKEIDSDPAGASFTLMVGKL